MTTRDELVSHEALFREVSENIASVTGLTEKSGRDADIARSGDPATREREPATAARNPKRGWSS